MKYFIAPKKSRLVPWLASVLYFPLLKVMQNIRKIVIEPDDLAMLRSLKDKRLLFLSNHPTTAEPPIVFYLSRLVGKPFYFMASRQVFNWQGGAIGFFIRRIGAFSVIAGVPDRESLKMARTLLAQPAGKLVIFPEGEPTSGENDNLMPFQPGVAQLGFWALEDARKQDPQADITGLYCFMKYVIDVPRDKILADLDKSLKKIEKKLGINPQGKHLLHRFLTVGRYLLEQAERDYGIEKSPDRDFDYRIGRLRHAMLDGIAQRLGVSPYEKDDDAITKWRKIFALIELLQLNYPDPKLPKVSKANIKWAHHQAVLVFDFIVIKRDYILEKPTAERLYEWLDRYESYLYNKVPRALGGVPSHLPRRAHLLFGKPFSLGERYRDDRQGRREAVDKLTADLRREMERLLEKASPLTQPLFSEEEVAAVRRQITNK